MALTYGFYNSYAGDRKYDAMQISEMFDGILADGIIPSQGQLFAVTAGDGMTVNVGTGRAWFFHSWTKNDSVMMLTVPASDVSRPRIDAVVLEVNRDQEVRANSIKIVSGEAAVNPVKPTLVTTDKVHQYPLAYITVGAGVEEIKAENIENAVGLTPTPFATGVLETTSLDELWSQWEGEWDTWFANIKLQLSGDIVANLQGQIDENRANIAKNANNITYLTNTYGPETPAGTVCWSARSTAPTGYLICDGSAVSRSLYAKLFSAIGTAFGNGDGSTTFTLPDLRAAFIRGAGSNNGYSASFGRAQYSTAFYTSNGVSGVSDANARTPALYGAYNNNPSFISNWDSSGTVNVSDRGWYIIETTYGMNVKTLRTNSVRPYNIALTPIIKY